MKVQGLMTAPVYMVRLTDSLDAAARLMWDSDIGCVVVVDDRSVAHGMLTDRDIAMAAFLRGEPLAGIDVASAMSTDLISCRPGDDVTKAENLMRQHKVRRLPVMDAQGHPVGVLSLNDLAQAPRAYADISEKEVAQVLQAVSAPRRHELTQAH